MTVAFIILWLIVGIDKARQSGYYLTQPKPWFIKVASNLMDLVVTPMGMVLDIIKSFDKRNRNE